MTDDDDLSMSMFASREDYEAAIENQQRKSAMLPVACPTCGSDCNERDELMKAERAIDRLTAERKLYHELIYAVGNKHPGETRHQTALRYIRQAELSREENSPTDKEQP